MLSDLIYDLIQADDANEKEKAYRRLERVGVDRITADIVASKVKEEEHYGISD